MAGFGNSDESIGIRVKTTADNSGLDSASSAVDKLNSSSKNATASTSKLTQAVTMGNAAYDAIKNTVSATVRYMESSIKAANDYQGSMLGLSTTASAFGKSSGDARDAAQQLAQDGLMTVADAAMGLKNLLASGFSLDEAINLMNAFKDSASFSRQAALGFGESIRGATEGIKNGNSLLVDNVGITKNLSIILQEAGKSQTDVMRTSSDASVRQALYNGILREAAAQTGNASLMTGTFAGKQAQASAQTIQLKQNLGAVAQALQGPLISGYTSIIAANQQSIISFGGAALAAVGVSVALFGVIKMIQLFSVQSLIAAATNPLLLALTAIGVVAGIVAYKAMDNLQKKVGEANKSFVETSGTMGTTVPAAVAKSSGAMEKLADQLKKVDDNILKAKRDFSEQLAEMVQSHQQKVLDLKIQLDDENAAFKKSTDKKTQDYNESIKEMDGNHKDSADELQRQIDDEVALGKWANQQKILDLQEKLAKENADYKADFDRKKMQYDQDVLDAKTSHEEKTNSLQTQLETENALLTKHAGDVSSIKNVMLLDEIDKLKRSHDEQIKSYEEQRASAIKNSKEATDGVASNWGGLADTLKQNNGPMSDAGKALGDAMGNALKESFKQALKDVGSGIANWMGDFGQKILRNTPGGVGTYFQEWEKQQQSLRDWANAPLQYTGPKYALGGVVSTPTIGMFGEDGPEAIIPLNKPQRAREVMAEAGLSTGGVTVNQTNYNYSQYDLDAASRDLGYRLALAR